MKIANIKPNFQINKSNLKSNPAFNGRTFSPEQLKKCEEIIFNAQMKANVNQGIATTLGCITFGAGLFFLLKNMWVRSSMIEELAKELSINDESANKIELESGNSIFNMTKVGNKFIKKASELD